MSLKLDSFNGTIAAHQHVYTISGSTVSVLGFKIHVTDTSLSRWYFIGTTTGGAHSNKLLYGYNVNYPFAESGITWSFVA